MNELDLMRSSRLIWFRHVDLSDKEDWVSKCGKLNFEGPRVKGRLRKIQKDCVDKDMDRLREKRIETVDGDIWRLGYSKMYDKLKWNDIKHMMMMMMIPQADTAFTKSGRRPTGRKLNQSFSALFTGGFNS